ncbi:MAG: hypothetical protein JO323_05470, partial [Acidobacteriia bacterium]|nr:hypothetical protein [Terriglobia bacterium]
TSLQLERISPENPRTIFFNDSVAVAWVRGGFIEIASVDPEQGVIFYMLEQQPAAKPQFIRRDDCQRCHSSEATLGVPGMVVRSRFTAPTGMPLLVLGGYNTDHRSPLEQRWGGWYVTGSTPMRHMGNFLVTDEDQPESALSSGVPIQSLEKKFDTGGYLSPYSDLAALMVFNHQMYMINLLTRLGWEVRAAEHDKPGSLETVLRNGARELVDYLLFIEEAPLTGKMQSSSGFPDKFAARGPSDSSGRSLRQLDLQTRLLRYPCSYMIYSPQFDGLPARARAAVYRRLWEVLSGKEHAPAYSRLSADDRRAILEILKQTKSSFADYSQSLEH